MMIVHALDRRDIQNAVILALTAVDAFIRVDLPNPTVRLGMVSRDQRRRDAAQADQADQAPAVFEEGSSIEGAFFL
jgi:hypothetical protein